MFRVPTTQLRQWMVFLALIAPAATAVAQGAREPALPPRIAIVAVDSELSPMSRALAEISSDRLEQLGSAQRVQVVRSQVVEDQLTSWPTHLGDEDHRGIGRLIRVKAMVNVAMLRETPPIVARAIVHPPGSRVPPDTLPLFEGASVAAVGDSLAHYLLKEIIPRAPRVQRARQVEAPTRAGSVRPVPARAPDSISSILWDSLTAPANLMTGPPGLPGTWVRNVMMIMFKRSATHTERQAVVELIHGEVVGRNPSFGDAWEYIVRIPNAVAVGDSVSGPVLRAIRALRRHPSLVAAYPIRLDRGIKPQ
jgi:hypothetical protein